METKAAQRSMHFPRPVSAVHSGNTRLEGPTENQDCEQLKDDVASL